MKTPRLVLLSFSLLAFIAVGNADAARVAGDPGRHTAKGVSYAKKKNYDKAADEFTKAIEAQPRDPKNYLNRGTVYQLTGKPKEALQDFDKAIELNPRQPDAYTNRGQVFLGQKKLDKAIVDFSKALEISPRDRSALRYRAYAYLQKKNWQKAIEDYNVSINTIRKIDVEGRIRRGYAYRNLGQNDKAIEDFTAVIGHEPTNPEAYRRRAMAYIAEKNWSDARQDLQKILQLKPSDADAKARLKYVNAKTPAAQRTMQAVANQPKTPSRR
ncbi:MAG: tetratricopeptide repeat protein [Verrucomicrobiota bacterium]|nr:tetratricopeptide repeat protein [Verrucomicrobiota bacterium]